MAAAQARRAVRVKATVMSGKELAVSRNEMAEFATMLVETRKRDARYVSTLDALRVDSGSSMRRSSSSVGAARWMDGV